MAFPSLKKIFLSWTGQVLLTIPGLFILITVLGRTVRVSSLSSSDTIPYLHKNDIVYLEPNSTISMTLRSPQYFALVLADGALLESQGPRYDMLFGINMQLSGRKQEGFRVSEATDLVYVSKLEHHGNFTVKSSLGFPAINDFDVGFLSFFGRLLLCIAWILAFLSRL
ncbi:MAG: hypothetical protein UZ21_OP11001000784 [Microgenomates bacterium OLB22]|nr:MAG: hypothetical protein UZ21_OP11001000784 [Microgenomates bacterium OLB22]